MYKETCKICGYITESKKQGQVWRGLSFHLARSHKEVSKQEYYDKYLKSDGEGVCLYCKEPSGFISLRYGYKDFCNYTCRTKYQWKDEKFQEIRSEAARKSGIKCWNNPENRKKLTELARFRNSDPSDKFGPSFEICSKGGYANAEFCRSPEERERRSKWAIEKLNDPSHGFGNNSFYKQQYYKNVFMRSSWEVRFATQCDENNIEWEYEPRSFEVGVGGKNRYIPDFKLSSCWVEIKPKYFIDSNLLKVKAKFEKITGQKLHILSIEDFSPFFDKYSGPATERSVVKTS